jgi:hypothetical protein
MTASAWGAVEREKVTFLRDGHHESVLHILRAKAESAPVRMPPRCPRCASKWRSLPSAAGTMGPIDASASSAANIVVGQSSRLADCRCVREVGIINAGRAGDANARC